MTGNQSAKTVLVTGAGSGFGRLTVERLAQQGHVVFAGIRDSAGRNAAVAQDLCSWASQESRSVAVVELNVTDDASVAGAVQSVVGRQGRVDVLVNNAGVLCYGITEAFVPDQVRAVFEVNVIGPHRVSRAVLPHMRRQKSGLIIQVSSVLGRNTVPCLGVYGASKSALEALTECLRDELAESGVDVVLLEPGAYSTGLAAKIMSPADPQRAAECPAAERLSRRVGERFAALTTGPAAPDPQEVAMAIARLIGLPPGSHPLRTVLGRAVQETARFNELAEECRRRAHAESGL